MSILTSFKKLVDPERARIEEAEKRAERERPRSEDEGGGEPPKLRCKVCGRDGDDAYCPDCLADTMVEVKRR